jgi:hypothetical protein
MLNGLPILRRQRESSTEKKETEKNCDLFLLPIRSKGIQISTFTKDRERQKERENESMKNWI